MKQKKSYWRFVNFTKSEKHIKEEKYMLTEEQKRNSEHPYEDEYEMAYKPETKEDIKSFFMDKYLGIEEVLKYLGCSFKKVFKKE